MASCNCCRVSLGEFVVAALIVAATSSACHATAQRDGFRAPYPNSVAPAEVLANVKTAARYGHLGTGLNMVEIEMRDRDLRIRRILEVGSEMPPPGYLVVELEDVSGSSIADVAITRVGTLFGAQDVRTKTPRRALDLEDASYRVSARIGSVAQRAEYVFFPSAAEPGSSIFRPLVAVTTDRGAVYVNSAGATFVDEGAAIVNPDANAKTGAATNIPKPTARTHRLQLMAH